LRPLESAGSLSHGTWAVVVGQFTWSSDMLTGGLLPKPSGDADAVTGVPLHEGSET
jgi:hypothetical protein